jgi:hypothetical protein
MVFTEVTPVVLVKVDALDDPQNIAVLPEVDELVANKVI